jgi:hypothetical protein
MNGSVIRPEHGRTIDGEDVIGLEPEPGEAA